MTIAAGVSIYELETVKTLDLSQHSGIITIEEPDTEDPFRTDDVQQLVLQFHDIDMTKLGYIEPEPEHVQQALTFARQVRGPLIIHCRAGVSRSTAIGLAIASDRLGAGNERQACEWLLETRPQAQPNRLVVFLADEILKRGDALITAAIRFFQYEQ